jgi:hypothetical protein
MEAKNQGNAKAVRAKLRSGVCPRCSEELQSRATTAENQSGMYCPTHGPLDGMLAPTPIEVRFPQRLKTEPKKRPLSAFEQIQPNEARETASVEAARAQERRDKEEAKLLAQLEREELLDELKRQEETAKKEQAKK